MESPTALRIAMVAMCLGVATNSLAYRDDSIFSILFITWDWSERSALLTCEFAAWGLIGAGLVALHPRGWPACVAISIWMFLLMAADLHQAERMPWSVPGEQAVRYLGPLALVVLFAGHPGGEGSEQRSRWYVGLLRLSASATFLSHGLLSLSLYGRFVDLVIMGGQRLVGVEVSQGTAESLLTGIGIVDVGVGLAVLRFRWPGIAAYMAVWGLITAGSRVVHSGWENNYPEMLIRIPNAGVPFALYLVLKQRAKSAKFHATPGGRT